MTLISKFTTKTVVVYDGALGFTFTNHVMTASNYSPITYKVGLPDSLFTTASIVWITVAAAIASASASASASGYMVSPVNIFPDIVRNELDNRSVKTNLTISAWLKEMAEAQGVNYSKVNIIAFIVHSNA